MKYLNSQLNEQTTGAKANKHQLISSNFQSKYSFNPGSQDLLMKDRRQNFTQSTTFDHNSSSIPRSNNLKSSVSRFENIGHNELGIASRVEGMSLSNNYSNTLNFRSKSPNVDTLPQTQSFISSQKGNMMASSKSPLPKEVLLTTKPGMINGEDNTMSNMGMSRGYRPMAAGGFASGMEAPRKMHAQRMQDNPELASFNSKTNHNLGSYSGGLAFGGGGNPTRNGNLKDQNMALSSMSINRVKFDDNDSSADHLN